MEEQSFTESQEATYSGHWGLGEGPVHAGHSTARGPTLSHCNQNRTPGCPAVSADPDENPALLTRTSEGKSSRFPIALSAQCPPGSPVSAPALPVLQALAEIPHVIPPIWPLQGSPGTQSRSTVTGPWVSGPPDHPSAYTSPPAGLHRTLSQRPRLPLDWTLCSHWASSLHKSSHHSS